jgi:hypothetical protein
MFVNQQSGGSPEEKILALLNQDMNTNCVLYPQVSLVLGFQNGS